jgi:hypothetical protein
MNAFVLPPAPQAASANELTATKGTARIILRDLIETSAAPVIGKCRNRQAIQNGE